MTKKQVQGGFIEGGKEGMRGKKEAELRSGGLRIRVGETRNRKTN